MEPEVLRLRARVDELEKRLLEVESRLGLTAMPPPRAEELEPVVWEPPPTPLPATPPPIPVPIPGEPPPQPLPMAARAGQGDNAETKAGLMLASRVGAVTVIAGLLYAFKLAADYGFIGPSGRVLIGLHAGAMALFAGDKLWHRGHRTFAQAITVIGIATFYFSFYAAHQLYHLIPQSVTFAGAVVTTAAAGALALRYNARAVAIFALLGGYLSPFLASSSDPQDLFFGSYLFVLNAIALTLARRKKWFSVEAFAAAGTIVLFAAWMALRINRLDPLTGGLFVTLQFAVFAFSPFAAIRALAPVPATFAVGLLCSSYSSPAYWIWAAAIALIGLALAWRNRDDRGLLPSVIGWAIGFFAWDPDWASHSSLFAALSAGFIIYLAVTIFLPIANRTLFTHSTLTVNALFFYGVSYAWFNSQHHGYMGLLALVVAACYLGAALYLKRSGAPQEMLLISAGLALSFVTLAIPIQLSGYSVTLAWAVESAVLAYLASRFSSFWPFAASWIVGFLAIAMLSDDARHAWGATYSPIFNARFIPFLVTALSLAANAYWTSLAKVVPRTFALLPLLAAHGTLLAGLHLEAFAWIQSGHESGADLTSQLTLASSLLLALYGLALVAQGISGNLRVHRVLGLALFAVVVLKLYLFDIWQLGQLYRILAFVAVGGLLLSGSFLYSRYRHRLLALLQDETPHDETTPA